MINKIKKQQGFSTIDALVALALLAIVFGPIISLTLGEQTLAVDSETNHAAILLAKQNVETAIAQIRSDFNASVGPTGTDPFYNDTNFVAPYISPCSRSVYSPVEWTIETRGQSSEISSIITWPEEARRMGGTCAPLPPGGWDNPESVGTLNSSSFPSGQGTGIAAKNFGGFRYVFLTTDGDTPGANNFYVVDVSDPENTDNGDITSIKVGTEALNGIVVAGDYAFVIYNDIASQLMVIDIHSPTSPFIVPTATRTLPNMTAGVTPIPLSIFYYDTKLYIGTEYLAFGNPGENEEFHIFNVSDPKNPVRESSINVDRKINAIAIKNSVAYLATGSGGDNTPLKSFGLGSLTHIADFNNSNNWDGKSLYILNDKLYFGLERQSMGLDPEFYIFNISDPSDLNDVLGSKELNLTPPSSAGVSGIVVQGDLAFLITTASSDPLFIMDISDPTDIDRVNTCPAAPLPQQGSGIKYLDDLVFVSFRSNEDLRIIEPALSCS